MKRCLSLTLAALVAVISLMLPIGTAPAEAAVFAPSGVERLLQVPGLASEIRTAAPEPSLSQMDARLLVILLLLGLPILGTTLAANKPRAYEGGDRNEIPVIAADILYEGAAIWVVPASGHARPLAAGDRFAGFAEAKADNAAGAAAAINVRVVESGKIELSVSGAVINDIGQPVYATDDDTFVFSPVSSVFVGFVHRFVSAGKVIVAFNALKYQDTYGNRTKRETISADKTLDAEDTGKVFFVDTDAKVVTLPAIADGLGGVKIVNIGAFGTVLVAISPAAADMILGPDITGADNKDLLNTKATAKRGDYVVLDLGDADGYVVTEMVGTWAREA